MTSRRGRRLNLQRGVHNRLHVLGFRDVPHWHRSKGPRRQRGFEHCVSIQDTLKFCGTPRVLFPLGLKFWGAMDDTVLLFFQIPMADSDALSPALRVPVLRGAGPLAISATGAVALVLRLPTAGKPPGELVWAIMGTETVTNLNLQAIMLAGQYCTDGVAHRGCAERVAVAEETGLHR